MSLSCRHVKRRLLSGDRLICSVLPSVCFSCGREDLGLSDTLVGTGGDVSWSGLLIDGVVGYLWNLFFSTTINQIAERQQLMPQCL